MKKITYFHRHPKAGFSINKVSQTYISEVEKHLDVEQFYVPCYRADPISFLRNLWFVFKHRNKKGVNHITGDIHYAVLALIGCNSILTVHDTCLLEQLKNPIKKSILNFFWYKLPFQAADKLVCISENTKTEILKITTRKDIKVIHNAVDPSFHHVSKEFNKEKPVVLQIGTGWNKNLLNVVSALSSIPCHLRIIGKISSEQKDILKNFHVDYSVVSDLTNEEIVEEYKSCDVICFCSIFEGFGMPVIEAQAVGRIVLTSNIEPIIEIAGDAALLVNPKDTNEIKNGFLSIIRDDLLRNTIIQKGYKNIDRFTSTNIAQKYMELYKEFSCKSIVVNATALRSGGALTILKQFIEAIPADGFTYIVFVDESVKLETTANVRLVQLNKRSFLKRFCWDAFGVKKWLKANHIVPNVAVSLQNTNFRINTQCPNYIYYHQPVPLFPFKWNFFKVNQRLLWFYKYIYPSLVKMFINPRTEIFAQLDCIKESFCAKYRFPAEKVHVVFPKIELPVYNQSDTVNVNVDANKINFFFPAAWLFYKNHTILFDAFSYIDEKLSQKITLHLSNVDIDFSSDYNLKNIEIISLGKVSYKEVVYLYNHADCLLFPSYIETLGLPLIEAASFGLPVIAADLPYAREVLDGYEGVSFANYQDAQAWGNEILKICANPHKKFNPFHKKETASWSEFFNIIKRTT